MTLSRLTAGFHDPGGATTDAPVPIRRADRGRANHVGVARPVSVVDVAFAGHTVAYLVGPLDHLDDPDRLRLRLKAIAQGGPPNRIGLLPDPNHRRWRFDSTCSSVAVCEGPAIDCDDPARTLQILTAASPQVPDVSLRIHVADPWLFIVYDHGLGGWRLFAEIIASVGAAEPGFAHPPPLVNCGNPGLRATIHAVRTEPWQLLKALNEPVRKLRRAGGAMTPFAGRVSVAYARSGADFLTRAREIRDRYWPGVSISAIITSSFLRSLESHGITPEEQVCVMVDLNRYLPSDLGTLSNFVGNALVSINRAYDPAEIAASIKDYTNGFRALVGYGMGYAAALASRPASKTAWNSGSSRAHLVVSDGSNTPAAQRISWSTSTSPHVFVIRLPVGFANQIALAINRVQSELHLTASYYDCVFDTAKVQASLDSIVAAPYPLVEK
jgi:hypothetical protein